MPVYVPQGYESQDTPLTRLQDRVCKLEAELEYQKADIEKLENAVKDNESNTEFYVQRLQASVKALEEALGPMKVRIETVEAYNDELVARMAAFDTREPRRSARLRGGRG